MKKTRNVPKTRGVTGTGSCGHEFTKRWKVPAHFDGLPLAGAALDEPTAKRFDEWQNVVARDSRYSPCPDCDASKSLKETRAGFDILARWIDEEPLTPLDGSGKQVAFAETIRASVLTTTLEAAVWAAREATAPDNGLTLPVAIAAIQARYPNDPWLPVSTGEIPASGMTGIAAFLSAECDKAEESVSPLHPCRSVLAVAGQDLNDSDVVVAEADVVVSWLCLKFAWQWWRDSFTFREATFWIARAPYTRRLLLEQTRVPLSPSTVFAAVLTSRLRWNSLDDAWAFFIQMRSPRVATLWAADNNGFSLTEQVHLTALESALTARTAF